jgi:caffeoyl-CoA O-methyltransferase
MKKFESIYIEGLETYINDNLIKRPFPIMVEMEKFGRENKIPILSPATGSIIKFLINTYKPLKVLELGTGLGYSTAWMLASSLELEIDTLDRNLRELKSAETFLEKIKLKSQRVNFLNSHCIEYLKSSQGLNTYNLVFVDCDKICYPEILELLLQNTSPDAVLLFDNVLWHGRLDETKYTKPSDKAIQNFWKLLLAQANIDYTLFSSGDGLLLILKK